MLSKSVRSNPAYAPYEPKTEWFRSICFRGGDQVELSNQRPITRYFSGLVVAVTVELPKRCVMDAQDLTIRNVENELRCQGVCILTAQQRQPCFLA